MSDRTNTAIWLENKRYWQIKVQRNGERKLFTCSIPGKTGQRKANEKADAWLSGNSGEHRDRIRVDDAINDFSMYRAVLTAERRRVKPPATFAELKARDLGNFRAEYSVLNTWLRPQYKTRWMHTIGDAEVQSILDRAAAKGRSKKTISDIRNAIGQLIKFCRRRGQTPYRMDEVEIPASARLKGKQILQLKDLLTLFSSDTTQYRGKEQFDPLIYAYRFAVLNGPRPGELVGFDWRDWDGCDTLHIRRSINQDQEETTGKNMNAIRDLKLSPLSQQLLRAQKLLTGSNSGSIFNISNQEHFRDRWYAYCEHNGIPHITPYELRHTFVSIAQKKLPDYLLKPVVGHSKAMDTHGIYGHEFDGFEDDTANILGAVFDDLLASNGEEK